MALTAAEKNFINAYRLHACRVGQTIDVDVSDAELDESRTGPKSSATLLTNGQRLFNGLPQTKRPLTKRRTGVGSPLGFSMSYSFVYNFLVCQRQDLWSSANPVASNVRLLTRACRRPLHVQRGRFDGVQPRAANANGGHSTFYEDQNVPFWCAWPSARIYITRQVRQTLQTRPKSGHRLIHRILGTGRRPASASSADTSSPVG